MSDFVFNTIVADPPWPYSNQAAKGATSKHYSSLIAGDIKAMPVDKLAAKDSHLYLWTTNYFLASGFACHVLQSWGFVPKTVITWEKTGRLGVGNYFRNSTEHILFGVKGKLLTKPPHNVRTCFASPWIAHSRKPEWAYELIEQKSHGPFLELFARREPNFSTKEKWVRWGNEASDGTQIPALTEYFDMLKERRKLNV